MPKHPFPAAGEAMPAAKPTIFLAVSPSLRLRLATTIENLLALLDEIDGDADREPELGFVGHGTGWLGEETDDREGDNELEPNLAGSPNDLEHDDADYDCPAFMWGGSEDAPEARP